jgi:electron-transferring-flavoprotein dehydrogenase
MSEIERDVMEYEVAIVGGGPAGLACAIRIKQLNPARTVCVLEKAASIGAHSLSGAVLEPGPLEELLPEWKTDYPGMKVPAAEDEFRILTPTGSYKPFPDFLVKLLPTSMTAGTPFNNHGNYVISLGQLTPWLAAKAEALGVDVFPGFAAAAAVFDQNGAVKGVQVGDMGLNRDGMPRFDLQATHQEIRPDPGTLPTDLRLGLQGAVAAAARSREAGAHRACARLAGRQPHLRGQLSLSPRQ